MNAEIRVGRRRREINLEDVFPGTIAPLSRQEEMGLILRAQDGDGEALDRLVRANMRFVASVALTDYVDRGLSLAELISEGANGLLTAIRRFDPSTGHKLITYAVWWIRQRMLLALAEFGSTVRGPSSIPNDRSKVTKARDRLYQQQEREPSVEDLAAATGFGQERVGRLKGGLPARVSLNDPVHHEDGDETYLARLSDETAVPKDQELEVAERNQVLRDLMARLGERERLVVTRHFGLDGEPPQTLEQIGARLGVCRERVRQIQVRALEELRHRMKLVDLRERHLVA